ncbi:hypothetical protein Nepgr_001886 [Nepenthes gracilis]|uniref:Armadillo repeat-containing protein 8 n=1 Tax=Nepenthes gracilis TaxID=150966 RepID=A0AAD3RWD8_NEPGR|nr:hypothetical protein Nepgr_001886 [Nepenthes gracilis]
MPTSGPNNKPEDLIARLSSSDGEAKLKSLRELKNQIIGNRTKKLSYVKLGAVPAVVSILALAVESGDSSASSVIIQSAAIIGSFACGIDAGVRAVLDSGSFSILVRLISHSNNKVVDAGARSLKIIYQSKLAPKYDFFQKENMESLLSLLNSEIENVTGLGASIITHSCQTSAEQKILCEAGVLKKFQKLLQGSQNQRDASLESLATIIKNNPVVISEFVEADNRQYLRAVIELINDRYYRTRLLACMCLTAIWNTSPSCLQDVGLGTKLIMILLELLDDPGQVGDDAPFALASLIAEKEDMQKLAFEMDAVDKLCSQLRKTPLQAKRIQGIFLALAELCSKLEFCRSRLLYLQVLELVTDAFAHDSSEVRIAACICLKSVSRSVKSLSAGLFMNEMILVPLIKLLNDYSCSVQVAALGAISNIVVDFAARRPTFVQCGVVKQLVHLSTSMDSTVRVNAVWALRNLVFLADGGSKEGIFLELTTSTLLSLICDSESPVQEQALGFVRNLVDGCVESIDYVFTEDGVILHAIGRQLRRASKTEGMYVLSNVASGTELHKEAVLHQLLPSASSGAQSFLLKFLQSDDSRLRTAAVWSVVNLTFPCSPGAYARVVKLRNAGIYSQVKHMVNDSSLDVKLRARTALGQSMTFGDSST